LLFPTDSFLETGDSYGACFFVGTLQSNAARGRRLTIEKIIPRRNLKNKNAPVAQAFSNAPRRRLSPAGRVIGGWISV